MIHTTAHPSEITVIRPGDERLTAMNARSFRDDVVALIDEGSSSLVVDFKDVTFLDSSGLGALVGVLKKIGNRGELAVCGLNPDVEQMFRICRMDRVFTIYRDADAAVRSICERR